MLLWAWALGVSADDFFPVGPDCQARDFVIFDNVVMAVSCVE